MLEFCVYTNINFRCGQGISVVTTPPIAATIAASAAFANRDDCGRMSPDNAYEEVQLPGRGNGLIANRPIQQSELIMLDSPIFVFNENAYEDLEDDPRRQLIWRGIDQLPAATKSLTLGMGKSAGGDAIEDIMQTNAFTQFFGDDNVKHETLLREAALLNHDCRPNVLYRFDTDSLTHHGHALHKIEPGEELLHTYIDTEMPYEQRQEVLLKNWGFSCKCSLCSQDEFRLLASNTRLSRLQELKQKLVTPDSAREMLSLYDKEGLIAPKFRVWEAAAYAHNEVGEKRNAVKYARIVHEYAMWLLGPENEQTKFWEVFIKHPEAHGSWKARLR
ncbi:SET domain-containing protein [Rhizodiscina lignyota]|uniref:SET domain-containing protein n=1 Tax=Rhizodiscina lignyota TaxID=1504668 RepID=A0A9P4I1L6_9PEZI|nr:SET domain-containing protein [Rhizodiscina lignyota]